MEVNDVDSCQPGMVWVVPTAMASVPVVVCRSFLLFLSMTGAPPEVNEELRGSEIDDAHSGTTSVSVYLHDNRITVCNVGDSRIVLGTATSSSGSSTTGGGVQAVPLHVVLQESGQFGPYKVTA